jgi:peptidoglycan-associated lipoprotein
MKNIGKILQKSICWLSILVVFGFAGGCAKKLLPPDIDGSGGSNLSADGSNSGMNGSGSGSGSNAFTDYDGPNGNNGSGSGMILSDENVNANDSNFPPTGSGSGMNGSGNNGSGSGSSTDFGSNNGSSGAFDGSGESTAALKVFRETNELDDIHFGFDQYSLSEEMKTILRKNAEWLKKNPNIKVEIQGHCDERGTNNYNLGLGERRSLIAKKYLVALGLEEDRLFTISYGEEKPFCFESTKECWQNNRRDHFMISE